MGVQKSHLGFPVVGIGASAGGVQAMQTLFKNLPTSMGMAFVVVVHLSPTPDSSLAASLQRCTRMPVVKAHVSMAIEVDHVYVISPAKQLLMTDGHLQVEDAPLSEGRRAVIDVFLEDVGAGPSGALGRCAAVPARAAMACRGSNG
jgi:two-component system CheB/CheR fusion protein